MREREREEILGERGTKSERMGEKIRRQGRTKKIERERGREGERG